MLQKFLVGSCDTGKLSEGFLYLTLQLIRTDSLHRHSVHKAAFLLEFQKVCRGSHKTQADLPALEAFLALPQYSDEDKRLLLETLRSL